MTYEKKFRKVNEQISDVEGKIENKKWMKLKHSYSKTELFDAVERAEKRAKVIDNDVKTWVGQGQVTRDEYQTYTSERDKYIDKSDQVVEKIISRKDTKIEQIANAVEGISKRVPRLILKTN